MSSALRGEPGKAPPPPGSAPGFGCACSPVLPPALAALCGAVCSLFPPQSHLSPTATLQSPVLPFAWQRGGCFLEVPLAAVSPPCPGFGRVPLQVLSCESLCHPLAPSSPWQSGGLSEPGGSGLGRGPGQCF